MLRNTGYQKSSGGSTVGTPSMKRTTVPSPSNIPAPSTPEGVSASEMARKRQVRKDDAIRKKLDQELGRKKASTRAHGSTRPVQGTVGSLRPSPALTLPDTAMVIDAARIMAAKRADAVLVIDAQEQTLVGIMTDKDLAFRVVAEGLDVRNTLIAQVMTKNPFCVTTDTNATDALNKMVSGGFRHLPCLNADGDVVGLLDITKCLYEALEKLEKANKSSKQLVDALQGMQSEWSQAANPDLQNYVDLMREKMASPDLNTILDEHHGVAEIGTKTSVRESARIMKQYHTTASLVMEEGRIAGIFTTKDIVVRVMAAGLEPDRTSVIRVMTPHPDTVPSNMTILDALKKMHDNHYLHLPVVDGQGQMAGLVDVLQVSFAMLNQMNTIQGDSASSEGQGPVWNKFWESTFAREETGSEISASDVRSGYVAAQSDIHYGGGSVMDSSLRLDSSGMAPLSGTDDVGNEFTFKFQESSGQAHRFSSSTRSLAELRNKIIEKIGGLEAGTDVVLSYCDEEGDNVMILQDSDIVDAVQMAYRSQSSLVRLSVTISSKEAKKAPTVVEGAASRAPAVEAGPGGLNPVIISGAVGLGVGLVLALAFTFMKKN
ncbi:CBS-domain-containing protein [Linnemannia elongata AG-77]|uniref:CBS-domain-containing protein n=1 Tax=Linnemannia elongata AG-77 TaxID=1314771 RepID=A0A197KC40_9FUNG|nr:CBS-domain-containing protein [Linnemannia elongata AG-77]